MQWSLLHTTRYRYGGPVILGPHEIRMRPSGPVAGEVSQQHLRIWPQPSISQWRLDIWNNWVFQAWFAQPVEQLTVVNQLRFRPAAANPFGFALESAAVNCPILLDPSLDESLAPYLVVPEPVEWIEPWLDYRGLTIPLLLELNGWVNQNIRYEARDDQGFQSAAETLQRGTGSCRDTAWLLALGLRRLGYPARYVSGYWLQVDSASAELHAWVEVYLPGAGWFGLDPTAGLVVANQHLAVARAPRPEQTAPILGSHDAPHSEIDYRMRVREC